MSEYLDLCRQLPAPTERQITDFVDYVAQAHSWYKHLPLVPPGFTFIFYLDPNAGCDLLITEGGHAKYRDRTESSGHTHYNWQTTAQYRERFGHLEFFTPAGTWVLSGNPEGALCPRSPGPAILDSEGVGSQPVSFLDRIFSRFRRETVRPIPAEILDGKSVMKSFTPPVSFLLEEGWIGLPEKLLEAGCVDVTGVVHPHASKASVWKHVVGPEGPDELQWPEETGGSSILRALRDLLKESSDASSEAISQLMEPERSRQKGRMVDAIMGALAVIHG